MRYQITAANIEILRAFIDESTECLQKVEDELLHLETTANASKGLDTLFNQVHTIKGLSSFVSLVEITRLSQQAEYLLDVMRKGGMQPGGEEIGLLLTVRDALAEMITQLSEACDDIPQGEGLEVDICCTHHIDGLIHALQLFTQEYQETVIVPSNQQGQSLVQFDEQQQSNEPILLVKDVTVQSEAEAIPFILTGVAVGLMEDFLLEADEHCGIITDQLLIKLDSNPEDIESLDDLFRRVHTLKGNTGLLLSVPIDDALRSVLKDVLHFLQNMESVLAQVRDAKRRISSGIINLCFEAMDAFMTMTALLYKGVVISDDGKLERLVAAMVGVHACGLDDPLCQTTVVEALVKPAIKHVASKTTSNTTDVASGSSGQSIRVSGEKLDKLMNVIGELAITKNVFSQIARKLNMEYNLPQLSREVTDAGKFVNRISAELEDAIMAIRMTEVRVAFQKYPRIIRDIALQTGKSITLIMEGEDTELDKNIIEKIGDPLLHLVRNSGDHGIETIAERQAAGKDPQGNVWLRAYNRGKHVIIEVEDDGRGMNPEKLKQKAIEKGFITAQDATEMSDEHAFQLIFLPGFSMAKNVTEISGRGVGMDVVRSNITALQGTIKITSKLGTGSKITMQLPLTLMVSRGLVVEVQNQLLVMALDNVVETVKVPVDQLVKRRGKWMLYHRCEVLGVVWLAELLGMPMANLPDVASVVVVTDGQSKVAMIVDKLINEQDILVKPLPEYLSAIRGMGGATIMGDGKVALVLNPVELVQLAAR